jgi:putative membrane protein
MRTERESRTLAVVLGVLVLVVLLLPALGMGLLGPGMMGPGTMWGYGPSGEFPATGRWGWGLAMALGWLAMLAFWGALIVGAALLVRWLARGAGGVGAGRPGGEDEALAILRRRYAAGELDQATFERMRRELQAPPPPAL